MKKGFTLIELLVVIIILGILAAIALPKFLVGTEASKCAEAKRVLGAIRNAESQNFSIASTYTTSFNALGITAAGGITQPSDTVINGRYWTFTVTSASNTAFVATATRLNNFGAGSYAGCTVIINDLGAIGGTHPIGNRIGD